MTDLIGQSLGRYHILEQLGEGGMAVVYKAFDTRLERHVAIKVILPGKQQTEKFLKRFEREAKALAGLSHPNIVGVIDYGEQDGLPYLAMEYIPGGTLKQQLGGKPMPWQQAARLLVPIARALGYAHQQKIIHRDVKPSNILITQSGEPMLSDFGIAKMLEAEETLDLTGTGVGVGTPEYMSPEQAQGKPLDGRSDIYSLGVVFYEMVTGRKPYQADTPMAVIFKLASEPLPNPAEFVEGLPIEVERILLKALARNPADRYLDMGALAQALENILLVPARRGAAGARPQPRPATQRVEPRERPRLSRPGWGRAAALVALLAAAVVLGAFANQYLRASAGPTAEPPDSPTSQAETQASGQIRRAPTATSSILVAGHTPVLPLTPGLSYVANEDFEGNKVGLTGFSIHNPSVWTVADDGTGNHVLQADNRQAQADNDVVFGASQWGKFALQLRLRYLSPAGRLFVQFYGPDSGEGGYALGFAIGDVALSYIRVDGWDDMASYAVPLPTDRWHTVLLEFNGPVLDITVNGKRLAHLNDLEYRRGRLMISVMDYCYLFLDDIQAWKLP